MKDEAGQELEPVRLGYLLWDPWGLARRRWPWMLLVGLSGLAATLAFVLLMVPVLYRAEATVLIASQKIPEEFVKPTVRDEPFEKINAMIGEILSREKLTRLIEEQDLYRPLRQKAPMAEVVLRMRKDIEIEPDVGVGQASYAETARLFRVSFREERPDVAATVANELANLLTTSSTRMRTQQAQLTTEFLTRELQRAEEELREQDRKITEFKEGAMGELPDELESNLRALERNQQQRQSLGLQLAEAETRLAQLATAPLGEPDESTGEGRLAALRTRLAAESAVNTDEHPNVSSLRRQIRALEQQLGLAEGAGAGGSRAALLAAARRTVAELQRQIAETGAATRELDVRVARMPARQEELAALEERGGVLREKYLEFMRKVQEAQLAETLEAAQQGERVSILDRATPPMTPERNRLKFLAAGSLASLSLALVVALLLELRDPVVVSAEQVEAEFGLRVLGSVPRVS